MSDGKILLTVAEAGRLLGLKRSRMYELIHQRKIPFIPFGSRGYRIPRQALERWATDEGMKNVAS